MPVLKVHRAHYADGDSARSSSSRTASSSPTTSRAIDVPGSKFAEGARAADIRCAGSASSSRAGADRPASSLESPNTASRRRSSPSPPNWPMRTPAASRDRRRPAAAAGASCPATTTPASSRSSATPCPQPPATRPAKGPRVLLVGGGSVARLREILRRRPTRPRSRRTSAGWISRKTPTASPRSSTAWTCSSGARTSRSAPPRARRSWITSNAGKALIAYPSRHLVRVE